MQNKSPHLEKAISKPININEHWGSALWTLLTTERKQDVYYYRHHFSDKKLLCVLQTIIIMTQNNKIIRNLCHDFTMPLFCFHPNLVMANSHTPVSSHLSHGIYQEGKGYHQPLTSVYMHRTLIIRKCHFMINRGRQHSHFSSLGLPAVATSGLKLAIARSTQELLCKQRVIKGTRFHQKEQDSLRILCQTGQKSLITFSTHTYLKSTYTLPFFLRSIHPIMLCYVETSIFTTIKNMVHLCSFFIEVTLYSFSVLDRSSLI